MPDSNQDDFLSKYTTPGEPQEKHQEAEPDEVVQGCLTVLPASIAMMLDLRMRTGNRIAIPYGYILKVLLDPSKAVEIQTSDQTFLIAGRNLLPIYSAITSHTALAITEAPSQFDAGDDEPFVESISVKLDDE